MDDGLIVPVGMPLEAFDGYLWQLLTSYDDIDNGDHCVAGIYHRSTRTVPAHDSSRSSRECPRRELDQLRPNRRTGRRPRWLAQAVAMRASLRPILR